MYEAMEICSRTVVFLFVLHDLLSNLSLISAHDACLDDLQTPDLGMYVGAVILLSVLLHSKLQYSSV